MVRLVPFRSTSYQTHSFCIHNSTCIFDWWLFYMVCAVYTDYMAVIIAIHSSCDVQFRAPFPDISSNIIVTWRFHIQTFPFGCFPVSLTTPVLHHHYVFVISAKVSVPLHFTIVARLNQTSPKYLNTRLSSRGRCNRPLSTRMCLRIVCCHTRRAHCEFEMGDTGENVTNDILDFWYTL